MNKVNKQRKRQEKALKSGVQVINVTIFGGQIVANK